MGAKVARAARGGTIVVALPASIPIWNFLPSYPRASIVNLGFSEGEEGRTLNYLGVLPSCLADRWKPREGLRRGLQIRDSCFDAPDPSSSITIVFTFMEGEGSKWPSHARKEIRQSEDAYECQEVGEGNFMLAFRKLSSAVEWCGRARASPVRMGMACGVPTYGKAHSRTGRQDYFGPVVNMAARCAKHAKPGEVLAALEPSDMKEVEATEVQALGEVEFKGCKRVEVFKLM